MHIDLIQTATHHFSPDRTLWSWISPRLPRPRPRRSYPCLSVKQIFNRWFTIFRTMQLKKSNIVCRSGVKHGLLTLLTSTPMLLRIIIMVVWLMVPPSLSNPSKPFFNESTCKVDTVSIIEKLDAGTEFDDQTSLSHQIKIVFYKLLSVRDIFCTSILWYVTYFDVSSNQRLFTIIPRYLRMNMNVWWWRHDNYFNSQL